MMKQNPDHREKFRRWIVPYQRLMFERARFVERIWKSMEKSIDFAIHWENSNQVGHFMLSWKMEKNLPSEEISRHKTFDQDFHHVLVFIRSQTFVWSRIWDLIAFLSRRISSRKEDFQEEVCLYSMTSIQWLSSNDDRTAIHRIARPFWACSNSL
jgi:hypothetical protein